MGVVTRSGRAIFQVYHKRVLTPFSLTDKALEHIGRCYPLLEELELGHVARLSDLGVQHLGQLRKLKKLTLTSDLITDHSGPVIAKLQQLEYLGVDGTSITDKSLPLFCKLKKLRTLFTMKIDMIGAREIKLLQQLPELRLLGIGRRSNPQERAILKEALPNIRLL